MSPSTASGVGVEYKAATESDPLVGPSYPQVLIQQQQQQQQATPAFVVGDYSSRSRSSLWSSWRESWRRQRSSSSSSSSSWRPLSWRPLVTSRHTAGLVTTVLVLLGLAVGVSWLSKDATREIDHHETYNRDNYSSLAFVQAMQALEQQMEGHLVWPTDGTTFVRASHVWNQCFREQPPLVVVQVANEHDVQVAVPFLQAMQRNFSISFAIRSGGHSYAGWSAAPGGILLALDELRQLSFRLSNDDDNDNTAIVTAGPAVRDGDILQHVLLERGYASVIGLCPDVALGGYTLGGGQGALTRNSGLAIDNLLSVRVVLATGQVVVASATKHADLFWALRGAGQGNFGVVTQLEFTYYPAQNDILFVLGNVPAHLAPAFLSSLGQSNPPRHASAQFHILGTQAMKHRNGGDDAPLTAALWWQGTTKKDLEQGRAYWNETLYRLLPAHAIQGNFHFSLSSWYNLSYNFVDTHDNLRVRVYNGFLYPKQNTPEVWHYINDHLWNVCQQTPYAGAFMELWGGNSAFNVVASNQTAFYWREAIYLVRLEILFPADMGSDEFTSLQALFDSQWVFIEPYLKGSYSNYAQASLEHPARRIYGNNLLRLQRIKEQYDPDNVFHHPHSIPLPKRSRELSRSKIDSVSSNIKE